MRRRSLPQTLVWSIALLLITTAGFYTPTVNAATIGQPGAAIFVSKQAPVIVSLLSPDRLKAWKREEELLKLKNSVLANTGIDYQQDVQPWLGNEITLAVTNLDIDRDSANGNQPGYLIALATNKPEKSREFLDLLFSKRVLAGANLTVEEYNGVKLLYDDRQLVTLPETVPFQKNQEKAQPPLAGAAVGNEFILFANDPKVLREAINNVQAPDLNLSSSTNYQDVVKQLPKNPLLVSFLNLPSIVQWQNLNLSEPVYDSQIVSLTLPNKGILAETSLLTPSQTLPELSKPVGALQYIPASTGLALSGINLSSLGSSDLALLWKQVTVAISGSGENLIKRITTPIADLQKRWGINLSDDIFSWVQGEYAIGLLTHEPQKAPDWIFVVEKSEQTADGIARLDAIASAKGLSISSVNLDEQKISAWTQLATVINQDANRKSITLDVKVEGVHTTLGNYEIFASNLEAMDQALNAKNDSLISDRTFQNSIAAIPQPNQGYIYLDWKKSQRIVKEELPILKLAQLIEKPFFDNLRSLTISSYSNQPGLLKGGVFLQLGD
jgi:hypothetical protein